MFLLAILGAAAAIGAPLAIPAAALASVAVASVGAVGLRRVRVGRHAGRLGPRAAYVSVSRRASEPGRTPSIRDLSRPAFRDRAVKRTREAGADTGHGDPVLGAKLRAQRARLKPAPSSGCAGGACKSSCGCSSCRRTGGL